MTNNTNIALSMIRMLNDTLMNLTDEEIDELFGKGKVNDKIVNKKSADMLNVLDYVITTQQQ